MQDYIDKVLTDLKKDLSNQNPPKVVYETKKKPKTISVQYDFASGTLSTLKKVKIIASREDWLKFFYESDFDQVTFDDIEPYFYFTQFETEKKAALKRYAQEYPEPFASDVFECVLSALSKNPLYKPRVLPRGSLYPGGWKQRNEISAQTVYLYYYLKRIMLKPKNIWPAHVKELLKAYDIYDYLNVYPNTGAIQNAVQQIISKHHKLNFSDSFWQTFAKESNIPQFLSKVKKQRRVNTPENNRFLADIFKNFS